MKETRIIFIVIFFMLIFGIALTDNWINIQDENEMEYSFVIWKIEVSPSNHLMVDDGEKHVPMRSFYIYDDMGVTIGDSIYKGINSKSLFIYKKNRMGVYYKYLEIHSRR